MTFQSLGLGFPFACLFLLLQSCLGQLNVSDTNTNATSYLPTNASTWTNSSTLGSGNRPVYLIIHVRLTAAQTFPPTYGKLFPAYAALHFNATSTDGPLEIQLVNKNGQDLIRVTDWGLENRDKPIGVPQSGYLTDYFELFGKTNATNGQILNASTGQGLVHDVWAKNTSLALKAYNSVDFMHACIAHLGLGLAPSENPSAIIPTRIAQAQIYWRNIWVAEKVVPRYPVWLETLQGWGDQVQKSRAEFNYELGTDASAGMVPLGPVPTDPAPPNSTNSLTDNSISDLAAPDMAETYQASNDATESAPEYQWIYAQPILNNTLQKRDRTPQQVLVHNPGDDDYQIGLQLDGTTGAPVLRDVVAPATRVSDTVVSRTVGRIILNFVRPIVTIGEIAGLIAIIVLDFEAQDDGTSPVCGVVSAVLGIFGLASLFVSFGLADFVMISAIIIGNVPSFTHSVQNYNAAHQNNGWKRGQPSAPMPPLRNDVQGILQYTLVGDRNKTGNEPCLGKGYKDCTAVYGPYFLASALNIEDFDAFAMLIHYNEGYPMAMADLIKAFTLSTDPDNANQVATIDCSHSTKPYGKYSWRNPEYALTQMQCDKPVFSIKRQSVKVPIINEMADQVYNRLMPQGNCSLVGDVTGGEKYPAYNLTMKGGAVAIACGIVGALDINGTATPLDGASSRGSSPNANQTVPLSLVNPGNQSSDGSSGTAYLAPPPAAPFQATLNLTNSICISAADGSNLFFPNGTYSSQDGSLGFDSTKADTLSLLDDSSLVITESTVARRRAVLIHGPLGPPTYVDHQVTYTTNQSATDTKFASDMQNMVKYQKSNTFTVHVDVEPDAVCLYQQPRGRGDFACFGPGGGDLPAGLKGNVKSVKAFGRASVEIFANSYGDSFAHIVDTWEDDLSQLPYDSHSSFAGKASAIWVYLEPKSTT